MSMFPVPAEMQTILKVVIYHGVGFKLHSNAHIIMQQSLQICLEYRSKSKKCDKQLTHPYYIYMKF
jgi:hypothetical protein